MRSSSNRIREEAPGEEGGVSVKEEIEVEVEVEGDEGLGPVGRGVGSQW